MAEVVLTGNLARHLDASGQSVAGDTVEAVLEALFASRPRLRGYILDDQGRLRRHVTVFVDGRRIEDREGLSDAVGADSQVYVMQALSGG